MPVMHKYRDRDEYYILTKIKGNIITFQLTDEGRRKLHQAGINPKQQFTRALLLDLYRTGDVFTHGSGPGEVVNGHQIELDFSNDPEPEKLFPACANCSSLKDLHLVELTGKKHVASILCVECRSEKNISIDTSIPLTLVSRGGLTRMLAIKGIQDIDSSVVAYKDLLEAEFESKWEAYKRGRHEQTLLIDTDAGGNQGKLL